MPNLWGLAVVAPSMRVSIRLYTCLCRSAFICPLVLCSYLRLEEGIIAPRGV